MNCPVCQSITKEVYMINTSFNYCPNCKEDISKLPPCEVKDCEFKIGDQFIMTEEFWNKNQDTLKKFFCQKHDIYNIISINDDGDCKLINNGTFKEFNSNKEEIKKVFLKVT